MKDILLWLEHWNRLFFPLYVYDTMKSFSQSSFQCFLKCNAKKFGENFIQMLLFSYHPNLIRWYYHLLTFSFRQLIHFSSFVSINPLRKDMRDIFILKIFKGQLFELLFLLFLYLTPCRIKPSINFLNKSYFFKSFKYSNHWSFMYNALVGFEIFLNLNDVPSQIELSLWALNLKIVQYRYVTIEL